MGFNFIITWNKTTYTNAGSLNTVVKEIKPTTINAQYSAGPKANANSVNGAANAANSKVPTQPAKNEPKPAAAKAGPARP